ncbi:Lon protease family protein [Lutispora thermophila]|uniref:endopeptidase La n=1 Tax=Lutispora thermophila DSM 19022 TaxID=1122184 RepID=A0A1M6FLA9_9FIRM|nr:ATP-binding protein [Lutispora thermophila]SHI98446.1 lon-related putative ATP-dependent protease [Lutispora thermophila DSM 19022]
MSKYNELSANELANKCSREELGFQTTAELEPLDGIIGQERAVSSMEFGLTIKRNGYNIFVAGLTGTGRSSYTKSICKKIAATEKTPDDWCYVYNFKNPDRPKAINLPTGHGHIFVKDMRKLVKMLKLNIPKAFESEEYEKQKREILEDYQNKSSDIMDAFNRYVNEQGFILKRSEQGLLTIPMVDGKPLEEGDFMKLETSKRKELEEKSYIIQKKLMEYMKQMKDIEKNARNKIEELEARIALITVEQPIRELMEKYADNKNVLNYLSAVQKDIIQNIEDFRKLDKEKAEDIELLEKINVKDYTIKYKVNLIIDNRDTKGAPVIVESNPRYYNLLGRIDYESNMGVVTTDFTKIKPGSIHAANGGYLIINMSDIAKSPESWDGLKRALKNNSIAIENIHSNAGLVSGGLKPEPIPLNVKVILLGNNNLYQMLYSYDEDFRKLFKIKADFDMEMPSDAANINKYARFISSHCREKDLLHFDCEAVAAVIDYSRRLAEHKHKLSTRFNDIVEILYEADAWARIDSSDIVRGIHVKKAIEQKRYRSNKIEEKLQELIDAGVILISTDERVVGQVNGLSVMDMGDYAFGKPSRVTATTFAGDKGITNIEREVEMSGSIHDKGVLILSGYLGEKFAQEFPLTLSAHICFEQLYDGVEGDSASSTELYALLSSLSGVPIKQYIAVTGSVNQKGIIQPIGGVNEKIEGFFETCKHRGLTGKEGVMIPHQNVVNLMLNDEIIEAVEKGLFHIYPVTTIEEGIEILTDMPAGSMDGEGRYPEGTLYNLVQKKIEKYARLVEEFDGE